MIKSTDDDKIRTKEQRYLRNIFQYYKTHQTRASSKTFEGNGPPHQESELDHHFRYKIHKN